MPTWTAVDTGNVRTMRELMENMRKDGWNVEYHRYGECFLCGCMCRCSFLGRIPISPDRPIEVCSCCFHSSDDTCVLTYKCHQDNYLDAYARIIRNTDPLRTALVFNCGMGAVRTTFSMVAACILRRKQLIERGFEDPFIGKTGSQRSGVSTVRIPHSLQRPLLTMLSHD